MSDKLKVIMFGGLPPDLKSVRGGVETAIMNLFAGFSKLDDVELVHLAFVKGVTEKKEIVFSSNVRIIFVPFKSRFPLVDYVISRGTLKSIINKEAPQIIHIQESDPHLLRFLGFSRQNIVVTQHGIMREELKYARGLFEKAKLFVKTLIERFVFPSFRNVIFISDYNYNLLGRKPSAYTKIYNAVNPIFFDPPDSGFADRRSIIYVGVLSRRKNLKIVLHALHELNQRQISYHLHVVGGYKEGDASYQQEITELVSRYNLADQVTFHGWLKQAEILAVYAGCRLFILPSLQETLPVSIAEALALGKVVIASDVGAISEMFSDKVSGFLFRKDDLNDLVELLANLSRQNDLDAFSQNARKVAVEKYHPVENAKRTVKFYREVVASALDSR